jgi:hypothetical protein
VVTSGQWEGAALEVSNDWLLAKLHPCECRAAASKFWRVTKFCHVEHSGVASKLVRSGLRTCAAGRGGPLRCRATAPVNIDKE